MCQCWVKSKEKYCSTLISWPATMLSYRFASPVARKHWSLRSSFSEALKFCNRNTAVFLAGDLSHSFPWNLVVTYRKLCNQMTDIWSITLFLLCFCSFEKIGKLYLLSASTVTAIIRFSDLLSKDLHMNYILCLVRIFPNNYRKSSSWWEGKGKVFLFQNIQNIKW